MLKFWRNGDRASLIYKVIENNFKVVGRYLNKTLLALPTNDLSGLTSDHISDNSLIYDTTKERWYRYSKGQFLETNAGSDLAYITEFDINEWTLDVIIVRDENGVEVGTEIGVNNELTILKQKHTKRNPVVQVYMKDGNDYKEVVGAVTIDSDYNVTIKSDIPFVGKVVIK